MCVGTDLEERYESSSNVFTAVVTGARFDADGNIEADFSVTELFKGTVPFTKLRTARSGMSCDTSITVGPEYLFFLGDKGNFGMCSGMKTIQPGKPAPWRDILRAYMAGETADLSSPWDFYGHDGACSLRSDFRSESAELRGYLHLEYRFAEPRNPEWTIEAMNKAGYANAVFSLPTRDEPDDAIIHLKGPNQDFVAKWSDDAQPWRRRGAFQLTGNEVVEFARELEVASKVRVEGTLARYPSLEGTVIRTTNAGTAISDFVECASQ